MSHVGSFNSFFPTRTAITTRLPISVHRQRLPSTQKSFPIQKYFSFISWRDRRESNPQPVVLETTTLPIELRTLSWKQRRELHPRPDGYEPPALLLRYSASLLKSTSDSRTATNLRRALLADSRCALPNYLWHHILAAAREARNSPRKFRKTPLLTGPSGCRSILREQPQYPSPEGNEGDGHQRVRPAHSVTNAANACGRLESIPTKSMEPGSFTSLIVCPWATKFTTASFAGMFISLR